MVSGAHAIDQAGELMMGFAERTELNSERTQRRYLWTDAFAVCNFHALSRGTGDPRYTTLALRVIDQVHHVLGRHRPDAERRGWLSGLGEADGEAHPTRSGLRIGKPLPERGRGEPFDEALEWERDGQYFHYLTKWMHALDQTARATRQSRFNVWARELAAAAHTAFTYGPPGRHGRRMVWKMSSDLSRVLVGSMGHHDPLDGFITCVELQATAAALPDNPSTPPLDDAVTDFSAMIEDRDWTTSDPLGIGGLLADACRVAQLMGRGAIADATLLDELLAASLAGLSQYMRRGDLRQPAAHRLAFRELGLAIGLSAISRIDVTTASRPAARASATGAQARLAALAPYASVGAEIESFWLEPGHREAESWIEHLDINEVMLATSLVPDGFLVLS
jgi:hypothetical protein